MPSYAPHGDTTNYPTVTVEIGFSTVSSGSSVWNVGLWNTAKWSGRDVVWTDVTQYVRRISTSRENNRDTGGYPAGTATLTLSNSDARFTPGNGSSPYASGGVSKVVPKVPIRIRATWAGTTYGVFFGRINSWADEYPGMGKDCVTTITCSDTTADLAAIELASIVAAGAGEAAGQRISRIISAAGWSYDTDIGVGAISTMQATTLGDNALSLAQLTAVSDGGDLFADGNGALVFQDGNFPVNNARANTAQVTFGSGVGEVKFADPVLTYDDTLIFNTIRFTRVGGTEQTQTDPDSVALYGQRTSQRSDLICQTDSQAASLANLELFKFRDPEYRVAALLVQGAVSPAAYWPLLLDARFGDYCIAKVPTPSGITITRNVFITGISHQIDSDGDWQIRFAFRSATPYVNVWSGWDEGVWDTMTWYW
jgi:hypothetical protein